MDSNRQGRGESQLVLMGMTCWNCDELVSVAEIEDYDLLRYSCPVCNRFWYRKVPSTWPKR